LRGSLVNRQHGGGRSCPQIDQLLDEDPPTTAAPQGRGRVQQLRRIQQLRRSTLPRTPARCHRDAALARDDAPTYIHEERRLSVRTPR